MTQTAWAIFIALAMLFGGCQRDVAPPESPPATTPRNPVATATATVGATATLPFTPSPAPPTPEPRTPTFKGVACIPAPFAAGPGIEAAFGNGNGPFCVVWRDRFSNESAFVVSLGYSPSGEEFRFETAPNVIEFIFPPEAWPKWGAPVVECLERQAYGVRVVAVLPDGEHPVGGGAVQIECAGR